MPTAAELLATFPATSARPTVVFVHGAWADASSWTEEVKTLQEAGFTARALPNPVSHLMDDAQDIAAVARTIKGPVVLVGHSYGGSVITNSGALAGNVKALVYVDAVIPAKGENNIALIGEASALNAPAETLYDIVDYAGAPEGARTNYLKESVFVEQFAHELPAARARVLYAEQRAAADPAFGTPSEHAAWETIPSWALIASGDRILTAAAKTEQAERAGATVTHYEGGGHLTLIADPEAVSQVIARAVLALA